MFLGDMSEMHKKAIKERKLMNDEEKREKTFLQQQVQKARNESKKIKEKLQLASENYDDVYSQAQEFLQNCPDKSKCEELLRILDQTDEDKQDELKAITYQQKAIERKEN